MRARRQSSARKWWPPNRPPISRVTRPPTRLADTTFRRMPPGTYTITVTAPSFQTSTTTGVRLAPEQVVRTNVVLTIGQLTQNVEVTADAIALQTDRADIRDDVTSRTLQNVPVPIGRNYQMLFVTVPGVSPPTNANSFTANSNRGLIISVNGGSQNTNTRPGRRYRDV